MDDDNVVNPPTINADKGKAVLVPYYPDSLHLLFKKSRTREEDDVKLLGLLIKYHFNNQASVKPRNEHTFIRNESGERVDVSQLTARISELFNNHRGCVDENGGIKAEAVTQKKSSGRFSQKVFELSQILWGNKEHVGVNKFFLLDKSVSIKDDCITVLKFIRSYISLPGHSGPFNILRDFDGFHKFISNESSQTFSASRLKQRVWGYEEQYRMIANQSVENILDPQDKEFLDLLKLNFASHHPTF